MITVTILYPKSDGCRFDHDYYAAKHMPMVAATLTGCIGYSIERGLPGPDGSAPPYVAVGRLHFASEEAFRSAFAAHAPQILADIPNYTDAGPIIQLGVVTADELL